jgi:hypothetical protein
MTNRPLPKEPLFLDIRTVQELLGQVDVGTTMIDTPALNRWGMAVRGPLAHTCPVSARLRRKFRNRHRRPVWPVPDP